MIATGVVNGAGSDRNVGSQPNPDGTVTDLDQITRAGGTITIRDTDTFTSFNLDPLSCVARVDVTGVYAVVGSTGAYAGASGSGTFVGHVILVFNRTSGGCSEQPRSFFADITASGALSMP